MHRNAETNFYFTFVKLKANLDMWIHTTTNMPCNVQVINRQLKSNSIFNYRVVCAIQLGVTPSNVHWSDFYWWIISDDELQTRSHEFTFHTESYPHNSERSICVYSKNWDHVFTSSRNIFSKDAPDGARFPEKSAGSLTLLVPEKGQENVQNSKDGGKRKLTIGNGK